jgi:hypothetical protein
MATDWYAPNQQAVRADGSGPAEEGNGGSTPTPEQAKKSEGSEKSPQKSEQKSGGRRKSE